MAHERQQKHLSSLAWTSSSIKRWRLCHTAICDLGKRDVMEVVEEQGKQMVEEYLDGLLEPEKVRGVAMDMHEHFRQAVQMRLPLVRIVVDKFHIIRHINGASDKTRSRLQGGNRRGERGDLFRNRHTLLKGAERLADWGKAKLNQPFYCYPTLERA